MYLKPPIRPTMPENGLRTPIDRAKPRDAFCPILNINTFFKKRSMIHLLGTEKLQGKGHSDSAIPGEGAGARQDQVAHSRKAGKGLRPSAEGNAEPRDLVQAARDERGVRVESESEALDDARGDGDHVFQRPGELHSDNV